MTKSSSCSHAGHYRRQRCHPSKLSHLKATVGVHCEEAAASTRVRQLTKQRHLQSDIYACTYGPITSAHHQSRPSATNYTAATSKPYLQCHCHRQALAPWSRTLLKSLPYIHVCVITSDDTPGGLVDRVVVSLPLVLQPKALHPQAGGT